MPRKPSSHLCVSTDDHKSNLLGDEPKSPLSPQVQAVLKYARGEAEDRVGVSLAKSLLSATNLHTPLGTIAPVDLKATETLEVKLQDTFPLFQERSVSSLKYHQFEQAVMDLGVAIPRSPKYVNISSSLSTSKDWATTQPNVFRPSESVAIETQYLTNAYLTSHNDWGKAREGGSLVQVRIFPSLCIFLCVCLSPSFLPLPSSLPLSSSLPRPSSLALFF